MSPEQAYQFVKSKIKKEWVICFISVLFIGCIAHFYKFVNFLPNWDSLLNLHTSQNKTGLGRCFLSIACLPGSWYDLPWINGLLSLIYIGISSVCVCEVLQIKKTLSLILTGGIMVSFPTVTSTLAYNYTADGYFVAMLCMALAVLLIARSKKGMIPAIFLIAFGYGVYQAYITFAITLILLYLLEKILFFKTTWKEFRTLVCRYLMSGILGSAIYWISLKLILVITDDALLGYQNIDSAFSMEQLRPFYSFLRATYRFLMYFFDPSSGINLFWILNILMMALIAGFGSYYFFARRIYKEKWKIGAIFLCLLVLPAGSCLLFFVSPYLDYHNIMVMNFSLIYLIPIIFYEHMNISAYRIQLLKQWLVAAICAMTIFNFILLANISYQKMHMAYEKSYGVIVRLADRIEKMPESVNCKKIAVFGFLPDSESISVCFPPDMTGITDSYIIRKQDTDMDENVTQAMLRDYCGLSFENTTAEEVEVIEKTEEFKNMSCWPEQDSIKVINDDTLVIKFGEEEPEDE